MTELKRDIDDSKVIVGYFSTQFSIMVRTSRQKINKEIEDLNSTINQLDLADIYRTLHPITNE